MHVNSSRIGKSEVLVAVMMKIQVFWDMIHGWDGYPHRLVLCNISGVCTDPEDRGLKLLRNVGNCTLSGACTDPEDRGIKLLQNFGNYLPNDTAPYTRRLESLIAGLTWPSVNNFINAVFQCYITTATVMDSNRVIMAATNPPTKKTKINYKLLPIKAHYFFFMACK